MLLKSTATDSRGFTCKLADFGMARLLDSDRTHVSTQTYGTISYMPAELLREGKLTRGVDTYSFAILMWELFSGQILHTGLTMAQVGRRPSMTRICICIAPAKRATAPAAGR